MKKGMILLKEVGYLLLAMGVIAIIILSFSKGCSLVQSGKEEAQAKGTLNQITNILNSLNVGEQSTLVLYSPKGYYLESFGAHSQCTTHCLCICKNKKCSGSQSYCRDLKKPLQKKFSSRIGMGSLLIINHRENYQFSAAIEDTFEDEVNSNKNCSGPLVDIGEGYKIRESLKIPLENAKQYAKSLGINLIVSDAYRTPQQQEERLNTYGPQIACTPKQTSEGYGLNCPHVTGCALDVCFGEICKRTINHLPAKLDNPDTRLLKQIMEKYGFRGIKGEYWHFEYGLNSRLK